MSVRLVEAPGTGRCRVALSVTRRTGNAVTRNRIRRRLRAGLAELDRQGSLPEVAMVVSGDGRGGDVAFPDLVDHIDRAVTRARAS